MRCALRMQTRENAVVILLTARESVEKYAGYIPYEIRVLGADQEGIVHSVTHHMSSWEINIETLQYQSLQCTDEWYPFVRNGRGGAYSGLSQISDRREALEEVADRSGIDGEVVACTG